MSADDTRGRTQRKITVTDANDVRVRLVESMGESEALFADGLDEAIIGHFRRCGQPPVVAYSYEKCIAIFMRRDGMSYEDAVEWIEFNVVGAWVGPQTPAFMHELPGESIAASVSADVWRG